MREARNRRGMLSPWWLPRRFRRWNKAYADAHGYFWTSCVLCGFEYGGHEWGGCQSVWTRADGSQAESVCFNHTQAELDAENERRFPQRQPHGQPRVSVRVVSLEGDEGEAGRQRA